MLVSFLAGMCVGAVGFLGLWATLDSLEHKKELKEAKLKDTIRSIVQAEIPRR